MPDSVNIVRMVEQRASFAGWLNMKVHSTTLHLCTEIA